MNATWAEDQRQDPALIGKHDILRVLGGVFDPELDEPITDLGFVRSVSVAAGDAGTDVHVHLRLPTSFCSPNFAYLMASDSKDAITAVTGVGSVVVELDDHHDSDLINAGLAADAGYRGTFGHEADDSLDELRLTFQRKAHTAAMERCLTELLRSDPSFSENDLATVHVRDLLPGRNVESLLRRRETLDLSISEDALVMVNHAGYPFAVQDIPMALRRARSTRISIDGNAHFCRGLLRTRYAGSGADQVERPEGAETSDRHRFLPFTVKEHHP
ncbi:iron-sulfur cluster assembly protein [Paenarthrobacter sp. A20]|uniref:iron-sulfur cluster assembly protein n=1 Tax=Paenarthrobacter sp. A20 TaxID=2817891 RepID=UPI00209C796D|nr:iron-sulfur cluster assembly protein [Paenarthrobacter sp. A20]MCP1413610.1 metal-sulfur cluster biosynthetic enzyme [Paenarthrobacter sp. A20]